MKKKINVTYDEGSNGTYSYSPLFQSIDFSMNMDEIKF